MPNVNLDDEEWQKVISIIASAPWSVANPLLMKIGDQLRRQHDSAGHEGEYATGNSKMQEMPANKGEVGVKHNA